MSTQIVLVLIAALLGVLGRTLIPYLQILQEKPDTPFDRKFLLPAGISLLISLITFPLVLSQFPESVWSSIGIPGLAVVFAAAWGVNDITRSGQKRVAG